MTADIEATSLVTQIATGHLYLATKEDIANIRADMANMRAEMANMKAELIRWIVGAVIVGMTAAVGLTVLIIRILGPWG